MIPQETVQRILESADIVEVVGEFVNLKKRGASMIACCPFHNEKTPSFNVSPSKGIYKCFGCGKGGDSVKFVMELEGLSYPDALRWLAKKYGIEVKEREFTDEDLKNQNEKESLFIALEYAQKYFTETLFESEEGQSVGQSYFKERGFSDLTVQKFNLGYALQSREAFYKKAEKAGFSMEILSKGGLISGLEENNIRDRFRGRVIFPIHNVAGKPIAFGARILKPDPKAPKYINSPETEIYVKSNIVYGIAQAKNAIRNLDNCFLVEGYTDVISLHQAGIENVVASSGTSLTPNQVRLMRRFSSNITVLYDGDSAGIKASIRGFDIILEEDMDVKAVVFPDGDDPDSYIRKVGGAAFSEYIKNNQKDFIRFKTELALQDIENDPIKKANLITDLVATIVKIPNPIKRSVFYQEVSQILDIDEQILIIEANKLLKVKGTETKKGDGGITLPPAPVRNLELELAERLERSNAQEEALIKDLLVYGQAVIEFDEETKEKFTLADYLIGETSDLSIETPVLKKIYDLYKYHFVLNNQTPPSHSIFTSHTDEEIQKLVINWLSPKHELSEKWSNFEIFIP
ncbi:MAG: DNA primase [Cytophagaceae bacterium]|nr:DNA primase [Cytophagaceae bacterium]